jgi:hypothetical protein
MPVLMDFPITAKAWHDRVSARNGVQAPRPDAVAAAHAGSAGPWEATVQELASYIHLKKNWDGYGADAPSHEVIESAIGLAFVYLENDVEPPQRVAPGVAGSVIFEWQDADGTYATVEVDAPLHAEVMIFEPGKPVQQWTLPST